MVYTVEHFTDFIIQDKKMAYLKAIEASSQQLDPTVGIYLEVDNKFILSVYRSQDTIKSKKHYFRPSLLSEIHAYYHFGNRKRNRIHFANSSKIAVLEHQEGFQTQTLSDVGEKQRPVVGAECCLSHDNCRIQLKTYMRGLYMPGCSKEDVRPDKIDFSIPIYSQQ